MRCYVKFYNLLHNLDNLPPLFYYSTWKKILNGNDLLFLGGKKTFNFILHYLRLKV